MELINAELKRAASRWARSDARHRREVAERDAAIRAAAGKVPLRRIGELFNLSHQRVAQIIEKD